MAGRSGSGHTHGIMNLLFPPTLLLTLPAEPGNIFITVLLITLMVAFPLRMESRRGE